MTITLRSRDASVSANTDRTFGHVAGALLVLGLVAAAPGAQAASRTIPVGGTGGGKFETHCPANQALVGFSTRSGSATDNIAPVCAPLRLNLTTGAAHAMRGTGGGGGGSPRMTMCPANTVVHSLNVFVDKYEIVNHVEFLCRDLHNSAPFGQVHVQPHGGKAARSYAVHCQTGHIPNGIHGNSGSLVDRVGMLCDSKSTIASR